MSTERADKAIGIFDSGLGGLTVARAVRRAFPKEAICYLGDTARVPYGAKSPETVQRYAREIIAFLLTRGVKAVVAACNTVSAAALPAMQHQYPVPVLGVVETGAEMALREAKHNSQSDQPVRIGVIGTATTIASEAYPLSIHARDPRAHVCQKACPLFVPLIEEGWTDHPVTQEVIAEYLRPMQAERLDALILGCTHYPLLKPALEAFFGPGVRVLDSAEAMAVSLQKRFDQGDIPPASRDLAGESHYFLTDRSTHFASMASFFMGEKDPRIEQISPDALTEALERQAL